MNRSIGRLSLMASAGTLASSLLGLARNIALAAAIGTGLIADSYNVANQVPNLIFLLLGGGTLAFVFVPEIMRHASDSSERGDAYGSLLMFSGAVFGLTLTVALLMANPYVISLTGGSAWTAEQKDLGIRLSVWCIPQIFFAALFSVASQLIIARGRFNSVSWAPSASSALTIIACVPIILLGNVEANSPESIQNWEVALLGGSALFGSALQTALLLISLRSSGFKLRLRFNVRGLGLRQTGRATVLTLGAAACYQLSNLAATAPATQAGSAAQALGYSGRGFTAILYAQTLLLVAQAVASTGLANVLLQRLANHYSSGDTVSASRELNEAILAVGSVLIPVCSMFVCLGPLGAGLLFHRGETSLEAARYIGVVLAVFSSGLIPSALHNVLIRPFYAVRDAKTPLRSAVVIAAIRIVGSLGSAVLLPAQYVSLGIAAAFGVAYLADVPLKLSSLKSTLGFVTAGNVIKGYAFGLAAGAFSAAMVGGIILYVERYANVSDETLPSLVLLLGGFVCFMTFYYVLTARSAVSLRWLMHWLRT